MAAPPWTVVGLVVSSDSGVRGVASGHTAPRVVPAGKV